MNNAFGVCGVQPQQYAFKQIQHQSDRQDFVFLEHHGKRLPFNKGHNDEVITFFFPYVINVYDIGMVQLRDGAGFGKKQLHGFFIVGQGGA